MYKFSIIAVIIFGLSLQSCGSNSDEEMAETNDDLGLVDKDKFLEDLAVLDKKIAEMTTPNQDLMKEAITAYQDYAAIFPDNIEGADYLLKASDFCLQTQQPEKAVKLLEKIIDGYPTYEKMEDVMFNHANHIDFELRDTLRAKNAYEEFIVAFPNSSQVAGAQMRIDMMSLSMEELGDLFMKNLEEGKTDTTAAL